MHVIHAALQWQLARGVNMLPPFKICYVWLMVLWRTKLSNLPWGFHRTAEVLTQELWEDVTAVPLPFELSWNLSKKRKIHFSQMMTVYNQLSHDLSFLSISSLRDKGLVIQPVDFFGKLGYGASVWPKWSWRQNVIAFTISSSIWVTRNNHLTEEEKYRPLW